MIHISSKISFICYNESTLYNFETYWNECKWHTVKWNWDIGDFSKLKRLLVSANTRLHICNVTTSRLENMIIAIYCNNVQIFDFWKQLCRSHRCPADTNEHLADYLTLPLIDYVTLFLVSFLILGNSENKIRNDTKIRYQQQSRMLLDRLPSCQIARLPNINLEKSWLYTFV